MPTPLPILLPTPRSLKPHPGLCVLPASGVGWAECEDFLATPVVLDLLAEAFATLGAPLCRAGTPRLRLVRPDTPRPSEGYRLSVGPDAVLLEATDVAGAQHAAVTLRQLARQCPHSATLPCLVIEDHPDFPQRGLMLDISRDKVPTLATLVQLVDLLVELKLNVLQLYTEHTFAYTRHREVWRHASPLTADETRALDAYCRARNIELVPNQNVFGHLERWLRLPAYASLAEAPDGFDFPWGHCDHPFSLCPTDPKSEAFVAELLDELLPNFTSAQVNVGCDETFDVGQGRSKAEVERRGGRVYLEFLLKIHALAKRHGRRMQFWGDIILHHPELIPEIPKDVVALVWGYEADHPFAKQCAAFAASGLDFHVCPGTSSWRSVTGRTDNALANLRSAAVHGWRSGAKGFLVTDWGDAGHWQALPVSFLAYAAGAANAWSAETNPSTALPAALDLHVFRDATGTLGRIAWDLGNLYRTDGVPAIGNGTLSFVALQAKPDQPLSKVGQDPGPFRKAATRAADLAADLQTGHMDLAPDAVLVRSELIHMATLARWGFELCAARAGDAGQRVPADWSPVRAGLPSPRALAREHTRLWLARNRPGGLAESLARLDTLPTAPETHQKALP